MVRVMRCGEADATRALSMRDGNRGSRWLQTQLLKLNSANANGLLPLGVREMQKHCTGNAPLSRSRLTCMVRPAPLVELSVNCPPSLSVTMMILCQMNSGL